MTGKFKTGIRALSVLLTVVILIGILPMSVFAEKVNDYEATRSITGVLEADEKSEIVSELPLKRDEYTKVFLRTDGTQTAIISGTPLHYEKDGKWENIDNTLEKKTIDGESVLQNKADAFTVNLPCELKDGSAVTVENKGYMLSFALQSEELISKRSAVKAQMEDKRAEKAVTAAQSSDAYAAVGFEEKESAVVFESVEKDTDIQYIVTPTGLKENIILNKKPQSGVSYAYKISADGLTGVLNEDNSIDFKDANGEVIFNLPAPFMFDANDEHTYDIEVTLTGSGSTYTMTYTPSYEWLSDSKRKYPVTVDPVVSVLESGFIEDTCVNSDIPNDNLGTSAIGIAAHVSGIDENEQPYEVNTEMYFKIGLWSLFENIKITEAVLILSAAGAGTFVARSIEEKWEEEEVTYNTKPSLSSEYLDYVFLEENAENQDMHPVKFDVTSHYRNLQLNERRINGVIDKSDYGVAVTAVGDGDSELVAGMMEASGYFKDARPVYEISFVEVNNMDSVVDTHSFDTGRAGTVYVNDFSLEAYTIRNDIQIEGNILPVNIFFHHNSNNAKTMKNMFYEEYSGDSYGGGWLTSYNRFLSFTYGTIIGYSDEYGDITYFKQDEDESTEEITVFTQINENNIFRTVGTLYMDDTAGHLYMERQDGTKEFFDGFGRLSKIEDGSANKNTVTIKYVTPDDYEGEEINLESIDKITDAVGREYRFSYSRINEPIAGMEEEPPIIRLNAVSVYDEFGDPITVDGENGTVPLKYEYIYDDIGNLLTVIYPDTVKYTFPNPEIEPVYSPCSSYTYVGGTHISAAKGADGYTINLEYNDYNKVKLIKETNGGAHGYYLGIVGNTANQNTFTYQYGSGAAPVYKHEVKQYDKYGRTVSVRDKNNKFVGVVYKVEEIEGESYSFLDSITDEISALGTGANLLVNGDFTGIAGGQATGWSETGLVKSGAYSDICMSGTNLGVHTTNVFRINGEPSAEKHISQTVTPEETLEKGDILTLGGWMRANPITSNEENGRFCGLKISYTYTEEDENGQPSENTVTETIPFLNTNGAWVFSAAEFTLIGSPKDNEITVYAEYTNQCNTAYFADIQLTCTKGEEPLEIPDEEQGEPEPEPTKTCPCEGCEEYDCSCTCESEEECTCPQCKRRRISEKDNSGNILTSGSFDGVKTLQTQNTYTANGNYLLSSCDSVGNMVQFSYNRNNGVLNAITDGEGNTVSYAYNAMRALTNVSQLVSGLSNGTSISNTYNYMNDRLTSINHNGFSYNFTYNTWGNLTAVKVNSENLVSYTYGSAENRDRLGKITYGNGNTVTYLYDDEDNITGIKFNNDAAPAYEYAYTNGVLTSVTDNQSGYVTAYTDGGIKVTKGGVELFETGYDSEDNYTEASNGTVYTLKYGDGGYDQATGISANESEIGFGGKKIAFNSSSDWFGRDISSAVTAANSTGNLGSVGYFLTYKETSSTATEYIDAYTSTVTPTSGTKTDTVYRYTYDNNGNIRTITKDGILQYTYNYDEAGQLTRADDAVQNKTVTYTYDIGGNIVSKKEYAYTTGALGTATNTINYTYDSVWKDKLTSYNGNGITYDAIGNPLTYDGNTFDWNGRILNGISNGTRTLSFKYNENSLRTEKKVTQGGSTTTYNYIWNGEKLVSQSDGTDTFYFFYNDSEYAPDGFVLNGTDTYLYTKNLQGDITGIADENGNIVTTYTYDAWGKILSVTGTQSATIGVANPFRYRGYYYDTETELYYLQSRYYNPEWGRFLNADSQINLYHILAQNMFAYANNNFINRIDNSGRRSYTVTTNMVFPFDNEMVFLYMEFYYIYLMPTAYIELPLFIFIGIATRKSVEIILDIVHDRDESKMCWWLFIVQNRMDDLVARTRKMYKLFNNKDMTTRTDLGIEFEFLMHLYMFYFDLEKGDTHCDPVGIDIDGNGKWFERMIGKASKVKKIKNAIINEKRNAEINLLAKTILALFG